MKTCNQSACPVGAPQPLSEFRRNHGKHTPRCKTCDRVYRQRYNSRPEIKEKRKEYYARPEVKEKRREHYARPEVKEKRREYYARPEVKERLREYKSRPEVKERRLRHVALFWLSPKGRAATARSNASEAHRRALERRKQLEKTAPGGRFEHRRSDYQDVYERYRFLCAYCGGPFETADHLVPLSKGGTNFPQNIVPCCVMCNWRKRDACANDVDWPLPSVRSDLPVGVNRYPPRGFNNKGRCLSPTSPPQRP